MGEVTVVTGSASGIGKTVREQLADDEALPEELARPEVATTLMEHYRNV